MKEERRSNKKEEEEEEDGGRKRSKKRASVPSLRVTQYHFCRILFIRRNICLRLVHIQERVKSSLHFNLKSVKLWTWFKYTAMRVIPSKVVRSNLTHAINGEDHWPVFDHMPTCSCIEPGKGCCCSEYLSVQRNNLLVYEREKQRQKM